MPSVSIGTNSFLPWVLKLLLGDAKPEMNTETIRPPGEKFVIANLPLSNVHIQTHAAAPGVTKWSAIQALAKPNAA